MDTMKNCKMLQPLLIFLFMALMLAAWGGYCRILAVQTGHHVHGIFSNPDYDLTLILGHQPEFTKPTIQGFLSGISQKKMETATGDCLPFLECVIPCMTSWKSFLYEIFLDILPQGWSPVLPIGEKDYVRIRGKKRLLKVSDIYNFDMSEKMQKAADYYNRAAARFPEVRFYVFPIPYKGETFAELGAWPKMPSRVLGVKVVEQFAALLSDNVAYDWAGKGSPPEEVIDYYYNTDHHLTMPGAYEVYCQLYHLITAKVADIGEIIRCKRFFVVPDMDFRGSDSRLSGGYEDSADAVVDGIFDPPDYNVVIYGSKNGHMRNRDYYYPGGKMPELRFFDHYGGYFGGDAGLIEYTAERVPEGRNILVIADSFDNCMEPLIAAHFHRSFFVDLRHFKDDVGYRFNLDGFILKNEITDVLFLSGTSYVMTDPETFQDTPDGTE